MNLKKDYTFEVNVEQLKANLPFILLGVIFIPALLLSFGFKIALLAVLAVVAYKVNYRSIYKFFDEAKEGAPAEWKNEKADEARKIYTFIIVGIMGSFISFCITAVLSLLIGGSVLATLIAFGLYHWALYTYAERYYQHKYGAKAKTDGKDK